MAGFERQASGVSSDRSTIWATTTAHIFEVIRLKFVKFKYGTN